MAAPQDEPGHVEDDVASRVTDPHVGAIGVGAVSAVGEAPHDSPAVAAVVRSDSLAAVGIEVRDGVR